VDMKSFVGAFIGLLYGAFGYAIGKAKNGEAFDARKFGKTVLIGLILGLSSTELGIDTVTLEGMSTVGFLTVVVDKLAGLFETKPKA